MLIGVFVDLFKCKSINHLSLIVIYLFLSTYSFF